jgi:hypothetical protein
MDLVNTDKLASSFTPVIQAQTAALIAAFPGALQSALASVTVTVTQTENVTTITFTKK